MSLTRPLVSFGILLVLSFLAITLALSMGSASTDFGHVIDALRGHTDPITQTVIAELRLPRAIAAFAVGGLLAVAGALMQVLVRNPLADPYILGVSSGAATFALAAIGLGLAGIWIDAAAFLGAVTVTLVLFALIHSLDVWSPTRLLLTGVVMAAGLSAVISVMLALSPDTAVRGMLFWLMGDFSGVSFSVRELALLLIAVVVCVFLGRNLNMLARGQTQAKIVGVEVKPLQIAIYLLSSLLTAVAVTKAGSIGFIGLIVPHVIRISIGSDHRVLFPCAALLGGTLLVLADTLARTAFAPRQLPVGALTALLGVPLFLVLIRKYGNPR